MSLGAKQNHWLNPVPVLGTEGCLQRGDLRIDGVDRIADAPLRSHYQGKPWHLAQAIAEAVWQLKDRRT